VRACFEAYEKRGLDGLAELWDPDINWRAMEGAPDDLGEFNGHAAMRRYVGEWVDMFEELALVPHVLRDLGDGRVLAEQELTGRAKLSGAETQLRYAVVYTIRDGKVVRGREYATIEDALVAARSNVEVVRRLIDAVDDVEAALQYMHPELEFIPLRAKTEGAYYGHDGLRRFADDNDESFETFEPHLELRELPDGRVLAWGSIHVIARGSGVEMDVPTGGLYDLRDGKVTRWEDFGSKEKALDAAGIRQ